MAEVLAPLLIGFPTGSDGLARDPSIERADTHRSGYPIDRTGIGQPHQRCIPGHQGRPARADASCSPSTCPGSFGSYRSLQYVLLCPIDHDAGVSKGRKGLFPRRRAGIAFAGLMLAGALASPLIGSMSDRLGRKPVLLTGLMISGASLWLMTIVPGSVSLVVTMVIAGFWLFSIQPVLWAAGLDVFGQREATVIGFLSVIAEGIGSLGSLLAGLIGEVSLEWAIVFSALLAFSTAVVNQCAPHKETPGNPQSLRVSSHRYYLSQKLTQRSNGLRAHPLSLIISPSSWETVQIISPF